MTYSRVLPRDLFNEAKLLKCMGLLCTKIHDGKLKAKFSHNGEPFDISLTPDGTLFISNLEISINDEFVFFGTTYNSTANYPLIVMHNYEEHRVFSENGEFDIYFLNFIKSLS